MPGVIQQKRGMRRTSRRDSGEAVSSMSTEEVFGQQFAKLFVYYRDALALDADYTTGLQLDGWNALPSAERDRMVAAARLARLEIETTSKMEDDSRRYYAKPGEAEWGLLKICEGVVFALRFSA